MWLVSTSILLLGQVSDLLDPVINCYRNKCQFIPLCSQGLYREKFFGHVRQMPEKGTVNATNKAGLDARARIDQTCHYSQQRENRRKFLRWRNQKVSEDCARTVLSIMLSIVFLWFSWNLHLFIVELLIIISVAIFQTCASILLTRKPIFGLEQLSFILARTKMFCAFATTL